MPSAIRSEGRRMQADWLWRRAANWSPRDPLLRALVQWGVALQRYQTPELDPRMGIRIPEHKA